MSTIEALARWPVVARLPALGTNMRFAPSHLLKGIDTPTGSALRWQAGAC
jgi:hypothetical protein